MFHGQKSGSMLSPTSHDPSRLAPCHQAQPEATASGGCAAGGAMNRAHREQPEEPTNRSMGVCEHSKTHRTNGLCFLSIQ